MRWWFVEQKVFNRIFFAWIAFPGTAHMDDRIEDSKDAARRAAESSQENIEIEQENLDEEEKPDDESPADTFLLNGIVVDSEIKIQQKDVQHLIDPYIGQRVGISQLRELTNKIKNFCRAEGWLAAVAYLPEQDSSDGIVKIQIASARMGKSIFKNESRLADDILEIVGRKISPKKILTSRRIEDVLYRINEIGGIKARGALVPNINTRQIDVAINVTDDETKRGIFYIENFGSKYSGRYRSGIIYDIFNLDNRGSRLELSGLISNEDLDNWQIDYSIISDRQSTSRLGISLSKTSYHLTREYQSLDVGGDSLDVRLYGITPVFKTIHDGTELIYGYKFRDVKEYIRIVDIENDKYIHTISGGVRGYKRSFHGDLWNWSAMIYTGYLSNRSDFAEFQNEFTHVGGQFTRSQLTLDYRKLLSKYWEFHSDFTLQNSSKNLNSSEKLILGGANGVRGYADGDASGDEGYLSKSEIIWHTKHQPLSFNLFFDLGGSGDKSAHDVHIIRSWGLGMNYNKDRDYFLRFDYARKIGNNLAVASDDVRHRIWFMAGKIF